MSKIITSTDVAKLANVSQSAVSRTYTPGARVSEKTRKQVLAAAEQLGYRPNALARSLISGESKIIGLVIAYLDNHFYPIIIEKLSQALQEEGYRVMLFITETGEQDEVIQEVLQYQIAGLVLASTTLSSGIAEECTKIGVPVLLLNRYIPSKKPYTSSIVSDNEAGGKQAAEHFIKAGYKRIAFMAGDEDSSTNLHREKGFTDSLKKAGKTIWKRAVGNYQFEGAEEATRELLSGKHIPDCIFIANDHMAFAAMDIIRYEYKLRVPEDIAIIGYDDVPEASWLAYNLTTIRQPVNQMIKSTVDIMLKQIHGKQTKPTQKKLKAELIERGSTKKL